mmetsp:Transcript_103555/g.259656  ORF Transcript_103555/g.259656 Transcript_103555/m.259656 type:complete len:297 (-) Transcript_103555:106-996(-)
MAWQTLSILDDTLQVFKFNPHRRKITLTFPLQGQHGLQSRPKLHEFLVSRHHVRRGKGTRRGDDAVHLDVCRQPSDALRPSRARRAPPQLQGGRPQLLEALEAGAKLRHLILEHSHVGKVVNTEGLHILFPSSHCGNRCLIRWPILLWRGKLPNHLEQVLGMLLLTCQRRPYLCKLTVQPAGGIVGRLIQPAARPKGGNISVNAVTSAAAPEPCFGNSCCCSSCCGRQRQAITWRRIDIVQVRRQTVLITLQTDLLLPRLWNRPACQSRLAVMRLHRHMRDLMGWQPRAEWQGCHR